LREAGKITEYEIEQIVARQQECDMRFGEAAVDLGLVRQLDIDQALSRQFNYPRLPTGETKYAAELIAAYQPASKGAEALRAMRSQLILRWFMGDQNKLAIVSVNPGDGGSLLTANLAVSFSQLGMRTLVVDANLRTPAQHRIFNLGKGPGLSDIMAGRAGIETITTVKYFDCLSVLPAGTPPPNPLELIARPDFRNLLDERACHFDVILCDAPAFTAAADAMPVSDYARGVMLVARKNRTSLNDVRTVTQQLSGTRISMVGSALVDF
jgi:chain length determinant protein tyrosine kinase EpsG